MGEVTDFLAHVWEPLNGSRAFVGAKDWKGGSGKFVERRVRPKALPPKLNNVPDLYFCFSGFKGSSRTKQNAVGKQHWLYADLDEVDPYSLDGLLKPTIAWETSPGRFQAAWRMDTPLGPRAFERLNKALTYYIKADKGGWALTKYLRVPGSVSHKRDDPFRVHVLWRADHTVEVAALRRHLRSVLPVSDPSSGAIDLPAILGPEIARKYWGVLNARGKKLVKATEVRSGDDRSAKLWDLHLATAEAGMSTGEMVRVAQACVYNKYEGQRREVRALWTEALKAQECIQVDLRKGPLTVPDDGIKLTKVPTNQLFEPIWANKLLARSSKAPTWLVDRVWGDGAYGWWAGQEKTYKSTLLMDLAVSVATGLPFLGKFDVPRRGPVLMIQEENRHVEHILHRIASSKALAPHLEEFQEDNDYIHLGREIRVAFVNQRRFDLTNNEHLRWLERWIIDVQPRLVILDPWYLMTPGYDESDAASVSPILNQLGALSNEHEVAIIIAHHHKKPQEGQGNMRSTHLISGTGVFGRWWASLATCSVTKDDDIVIKFEHRDHPNQAPMILDIKMDEDDPDDYVVGVTEMNPDHVDLSKANGKVNGLRQFIPTEFKPMDRRHESLGDDKNVMPLMPLQLKHVITFKDAAALFDSIGDGALRNRVEKSASFICGYAPNGNGKRQRVILRIAE